MVSTFKMPDFNSTIDLARSIQISAYYFAMSIYLNYCYDYFQQIISQNFFDRIVTLLVRHILQHYFIRNISYMKLFFKFLFWILFLIYRIKINAQAFINWLVRKIYLPLTTEGHNSIDKVSKQISAFPKKPVEVTLAFDITKDSIEKRNGVNQVQNKILNFIKVVNNIGTQKLTIYIECRIPQLSDDLVSKLTEKVENLKTEGKAINILNWNTFVNKQFTQCGKIQKNMNVPLLIMFCNFKGICGIPYPYLVDAEFSICPILNNAILEDMVKPFQTYCFSKQRHGK